MYGPGCRGDAYLDICNGVVLEKTPQSFTSEYGTVFQDKLKARCDLKDTHTHTHAHTRPTTATNMLCGGATLGHTHSD